MIMDSKGKLFGKISIVDLLVIILILAAIVGGYFRFNGKNSEVVIEDTEFYYSISINKIMSYNKDKLLESVGTPFKLDEKVESTMGVLVDATAQPAYDYMTMDDGSVVLAEVPDRYDVLLTFKVNGKVNEFGYYTPEMFEICAGKENTIKNIYCNVIGYIQKVWTN